MAPKTTNLAMLFADVSGSTRLFEVLGDATARVKVSECLDTLTEVTKNHNGTVIKTIGDEIMCTFPTADDAANASVEMHEELLDDVTEGVTDTTQLSIRVGFHFGPAIMEGGDVFGDAVNVAARMAAQAKGGQIITTQSTVDLLAPMLRAATRFVDRAPIKGKKEEIEIYEIIWQEEDVTRMATGMMSEDMKPEVKLRVRYGDSNIVLNKERSSLVMGRSNTCDLPINEKLASRQHVRIELRREKFFIIDQSTNGTHVLIENAEEEFLRREEMPLQGAGKISLGKSFSEGPSEVVQFSHEI
ncbi:MAG: adenylate/guanylate cyclase domain-containing protein [Gammaproteobacteria bacterium]|jgi:adenylate cyclase|nr:adenylate/guanylate cyclase domain-containing protein [Gammaproteobacteria bacterium]